MRAPPRVALELEPAPHPGEARRAPRPPRRRRAPASSIAARAARALRRLWRAGDREAQLGRPGRGRVEADDLAPAVEAGEARRRPGRPGPSPARRSARRRARSSASEPQREWWSISTLVTTAISGLQLEEAGVALVGLGDDPLPLAPAGVGGVAVRRRGREPRRRRRRPGRRRSPAAPRPAIAVVVVLPWVPATAISRFSAQSSASSSPRWIGSTPRSRASASSGLSSPIAVETTTSAPSGRLAASWPTRRLEARRAQPLHIRGVGAVAAGRPSAPSRAQTSARPLIPAPPMPMKCSRLAAQSPRSGPPHR